MQNIIIIGSRGHDYKKLKYIEKIILTLKI